MEAKSTSVEDVRVIYRAALEAIPHEHFTFGKLWLLSAKFEIRQKNLFAARRLLGEALGRCHAGVVQTALPLSLRGAARGCQ